MLLRVILMLGIFQCIKSLPASTIDPDSPALDNILNLLPGKELKELKMFHLKSDPSFQAAVKFFKSPEWFELVENVRETPAWTAFKAFLKETGIDLDSFISHVDHCMNATDTTAFMVDGIKPSLKNFLQDVKMNLGIPLMKAMNEYFGKVGRSDQYRKMVEELTSEKSKKLLENALGQPAVKAIIAKLQDLDVNVEYVVQLVYTLAGWQTPVNV